MKLVAFRWLANFPFYNLDMKKTNYYSTLVSPLRLILFRVFEDKSFCHHTKTSVSGCIRKEVFTSIALALIIISYAE